jgi:threonine/homoserine/homoserine lactone efflux protein
MLIAMVLLASLPGISVATVVSQAIAGGWRAALACTIGIIIGDIIFLGIAVFGLVLFEQSASEWGWLVSIASGLYLMWIGRALFSVRLALPAQSVSPMSLIGSCMVGLGITLADQKAVLFYLAFVPAFVDLASMTTLDFLLVLGSIAIGVAAPKLVYAAIAARAAQRIELRASLLSRSAGLLLIAVGLILVVRGLPSSLG